MKIGGHGSGSKSVAKWAYSGEMSTMAFGANLRNIARALSPCCHWKSLSRSIPHGMYIFIGTSGWIRTTNQLLVRKLLDPSSCAGALQVHPSRIARDCGSIISRTPTTLPAGVLRSFAQDSNLAVATYQIAVFPSSPAKVVEMTGIAADVRSHSDYAVLGPRRTFHPLSS